MSNEDQMAVIGRMVTERAEARRTAALLLHQMQATGNAFYAIGADLRSPIHLSKTLGYVDELIKNGGLDALRKNLVEYTQLQVTLGHLEQKIKEAGIE
jgi:hypothetical protein